MDLTLSISPAIVQPGQLITGQVQLSNAAKSDQVDLSPFQLVLQPRPNTPLPDMNISVSLVGAAWLNQVERLTILSTSPVSTITNCSFYWESRLPKAVLLPSFSKGKLLRCAYFVEVRLLHADKAKFRRFRLPITVRTPPGVFDVNIPASPYFADWMRISETPLPEGDSDLEKLRVYIPSPPPESYSMMESRLAELEKLLRDLIEKRGLKQPDEKWLSDDPVFADECDDEEIQPINPQEYRIDFNSEPFAILLLTQNQFKLADVVRGKLDFGKGAFDCICIHVRLASCEYLIENDQRIREQMQVWQEIQLACADLSSDHFSLSIPYGPEACANFRTALVEMQWKLIFQFVISKGNLPQADRISLSLLNQITDSEQSNDMFDIIVWELNLDVGNRYKKADEFSSRKLSFYIQEPDLKEFQVQR